MHKNARYHLLLKKSVKERKEELKIEADGVHEW